MCSLASYDERMVANLAKVKALEQDYCTSFGIQLTSGATDITLALTIGTALQQLVVAIEQLAADAPPQRQQRIGEALAPVRKARTELALWVDESRPEGLGRSRGSRLTSEAVARGSGANWAPIGC